MKNVIAKAAFLLVAGCVVLSAATPSHTLMRANIPFAFLAGDRMNPAGEYWVGVNSDFRYVDLRALDSTTAHRVALNGTFVPRNGRHPMKRGFLRFERYGSTHVLRAVGVPEAKAGLGLAPSKSETELAQTSGGSAEVEVSLIE